MKPIVLTISQWNKLAAQLEKDYPPSVLLIRSAMKRKLGFTHRQHIEWRKVTNKWGKEVPIKMTSVYLDVYNENKMSFFILKYTEYLNNH